MEPNLKKLKLDIHKAVAFLIDEENVNVAIEDYPHLIAKKIVADYKIWTYDDIITLEHPKTWWDAFKLRFFPLWLIRACPVKKKVITISEIVPKLPKNFKSYPYKKEKIETFIPLDRYAYNFSETIE